MGETGFPSVLDALPDGVVVVDQEGVVVTANSAARRMFGYALDDVVGRPVEVLIPQDVRELHERHRRLHAESRPDGRPMGTSATFRCRRRYATEFTADISLSSVLRADGRVVVATIRDVSERTQAEERLQAVVQVAQTALRGGDAAAVLRHVAGSARELANADMVVVATPDDEVGTGSHRARTADGPDAERLVGAHLEPGQSLLGDVMEDRLPMTADDAAQHPGADPALVELTDAGPALVVPLVGSRGALASLALTRPRGQRPFSKSERRLIELFAAQAAVALDYVELRDELQRLAMVSERDRIGRELHDGVIQALITVGMSMQGAEALTEDQTLRDRLEAGVEQIDAVVHDLRNYVYGLRPSVLARRPLEEAFQKLAADLERDYGVTTVVDVDAGLAAELADGAEDLVQLTRELLSNVGRHASALTCRITLRRSRDQALLEVEDDGGGFVLEKARGASLGLRSLEERVAALGGDLEIRSQPGTGTTVSILVPRGAAPAG